MNLKLILLAAEQMDWQQVVLNGGPPCFHLCDDGRFCGRAERWEGHGEMHAFTPLDVLLKRIARDSRRMDWLEEMRRECEGRVLSHCFLPGDSTMRTNIDAMMKLNPLAEGGPQP